MSCSVLQCVAVCSSKLQCVAVAHIRHMKWLLQCVAVCCSGVHQTYEMAVAVCGGMLQ